MKFPRSSKMEEAVEESVVPRGDVSVGEATWLQGKAQMLDEVKT